MVAPRSKKTCKPPKASNSTEWHRVEPASAGGLPRASIHKEMFSKKSARTALVVGLDRILRPRDSRSGIDLRRPRVFPARCPCGASGGGDTNPNLLISDNPRAYGRIGYAIGRRAPNLMSLLRLSRNIARTEAVSTYIGRYLTKKSDLARTCVGGGFAQGVVLAARLVEAVPHQAHQPHGLHLI